MRNTPLSSPPPLPPATRAEVAEFLKGLHRFRAKGLQPLEESSIRKFDEAGVKAYLDKMTAGEQQAISRRIMMDILKSSPLAGGERPARKRKPAAKKAAKASPKKKAVAVKKKKSGRRGSAELSLAPAKRAKRG
jgi:hypothetical protein